VVAGQAAAQRGAEGAGQDGQDDVEVDVERDCAGECVEAEGLDGFGEALLDVHPLERASIEEVTTAIEGADAVIFAAGAGSGSGAGRKLTMDRDGAIKLLRAATAAGVRRYLMISGAGVENRPDGDEVFDVYLRAKAEADAALEASHREWTILRPGGLTNDAGTGSVRIGSVPFSGPVPRDDVARVLARLLADARSAGRVLYLSSGTQPVEQALDKALGSPR
jgi:uncharacterized protein YbjT (DUF2867 family)